MFCNYGKKKRQSCFQQNYEPSKTFKLLHFDDSNARRTRSNDKVEHVRDVFEIWSQYLQGGNVPGL